jgi:transcription initiation factor TFIIE subunit alpha
MRLTQNKIEEILLGLLGEDGLPLVKQLVGKENVSEFDLAKRTKKDIKVIRKMLYILYNHNLVGFTRKKDKQKGWYIYYWTLLPESIKFSYFKTKRDLLVRLTQKLKEEESELFFICPSKCVRLDFDQSMDFEFHCPECGDLISQDSSEEKIQRIKIKIVEVQEELDSLNAQREARRKAIKIKQEKNKEKVVTKKRVPAKKRVTRKKATTKKTAKKKVVKKKIVKKKTVSKKGIVRKTKNKETIKSSNEKNDATDTVPKVIKKKVLKKVVVRKKGILRKSTVKSSKKEKKN